MFSFHILLLCPIIASLKKRKKIRTKETNVITLVWAEPFSAEMRTFPFLAIPSAVQHNACWFSTRTLFTTAGYAERKKKKKKPIGFLFSIFNIFTSTRAKPCWICAGLLKYDVLGNRDIRVRTNSYTFYRYFTETPRIASR